MGLSTPDQPDDSASNADTPEPATNPAEALDSSAEAEAYLVLLNEHEHSLAAYVHSLVPVAADAEDILQGCRITLWKNFSRFDRSAEDSNFLAWARKIALHQILNHRRSQKRRPTFSADPEFIEAVAGEIDRHQDRYDRRSEALRACLAKLPQPHRKAILLRYHEERGVEEIAELTERTPGAVYRLLSRIRAVLNECITESLARKEQASS